MAVSKLPTMPEYGIWQAMKRRCDSPSVPTYNRYGGRGIKVCDKWLHDFWEFYKDMGQRPGDEYTLERRNNDGNYEPSNCFWATRTEQARNRSSNCLVDYNGKMITLAELSEITGIQSRTLQWRHNNGFVGEDLIQPLLKNVKYEFNGISRTLNEWSSILNIKYDVLRDRLKSGWSIEQAFTTPILKPTQYSTFRRN